MRPDSSAFTVSTTAVVLTGTQNRGWVLHNNSSNVIYLGGSGVTTSSGLPIQPGTYFVPPAALMEQLKGRSVDEAFYAIAASSSNVRLLFTS